MIVSSGIACGVLLGVIEGVGVLMQRVFAEGNRAHLTLVVLAICAMMLTHLHIRLQVLSHRW